MNDRKQLAQSWLLLACLIAGGLVIALRPQGGIDILPTPPVTPQTGAWVVFIRETSTPNPEQDKLMASDFAEAIKARTMNFRAFDASAPEAVKTYLPAMQAKGVTIPGFVITSAQGKLLGAFPLKDRATIDSQIKQVTGL